MQKQFTITKKFAKHGSQAIIVIPKILGDKLRPRNLTQVMIEIIQD